MERSARGKTTSSPSVPEEKAKPADEMPVHHALTFHTAACGISLSSLDGPGIGPIFSFQTDVITCPDCRQALGLRLGDPDETSGVDLSKLEAASILRSKAANQAPPKKG